MHIILGALGSIVTILWLLHRLAEMGIDLGGLNPWLWMRRKKWRNQYQGNPVFSVESPMESTALMVTAVAKADGDMTSEEKRWILEAFEKEFNLSKRESASLLISSSYLLGNGEELRDNVDKVLAPSLEKFSDEQANSAVDMLQKVGDVGGPADEPQRDLITKARAVLKKATPEPNQWQ